MAIYSINRIGKSVTIRNIDTENFLLEVNFEKYCSEGCDGPEFVSILSKALIPNASETIAFSVDGKYLVIIKKNGVTVDTLEYNIYEELKEAIIDSVFDNFCDDCGDTTCCKKEDKIDVLISSQLCIERILTYSLLKEYYNNPLFTNYLQIAFDYYKCHFTVFERNKRSFLKFLGRNMDKYNLSGKFAIIYYIGFYMMESLEDKDNVDNLCIDYRIASIKLCATKYNILVEDLEDFFLQAVTIGNNNTDKAISEILSEIKNLQNSLDNIETSGGELIVQYTHPAGTKGTTWICTEDGRKYTFMSENTVVEF